MDLWSRPPCAYEHDPVSTPALDRFLDALRALYANGGALFARFRAVGVADPGRWFRCGAIVDADTAFRDLLTSDALRRALPDLAVPEPYSLTAPPRFAPLPAGTLTLDGEWAALLVSGGAYERFRGPAAEAKTLAAAAAHDLVLDRHEDFRVFRSGAPWTPWFLDVAWDSTWFVVDHARLTVTVLCLTDSD